jgi:concanavalin A-like lectin/glucanase superfamily protein/hydrazine synthase alpha subunit-like protein
MVCTRISATLLLFSFLFSSAGAEEKTPVISNSDLYAHWTFDEADGDTCGDAGPGGFTAKMLKGKLGHIKGVFGRAGAFSGTHQLQIIKPLPLESLDEISLAAWVRPTKFNQFNEIFRKEGGENRVLFSFQENGSVLTLGLNIQGHTYVECEAKVDPARLLNGGWHHLAATFDGQVMRIYLDGQWIDELARPGRLKAGSAAAAWIASSRGREYFQGAIDDLRLYSKALTGKQIFQLASAGNTQIAKHLAQLEKDVDRIWVDKESFAETMVDLRGKAIESEEKFNPIVIDRLQQKLHVKFPKQYDRLLEAGYNAWSINGLKLGIPRFTLADYLPAETDAPLGKRIERLYDLMIEYRPITPEQWAQTSKKDKTYWKETVGPLEKQYKKWVASKRAKADTIAAIDLALKMHDLINFRPYVQEAVAGYHKPSTPAPVSLTAEEAQKRLEADWLHQADQKPTPDRILKEVVWTRQLIKRLESQHGDKIDLTDAKKRLEKLEHQVKELTANDAGLYFEVRKLKREVMFKNPLLDFGQILMVDRPYPEGREHRHETRHRLGDHSTPGAQLLVLDGLRPDGKVRRLAPLAPLHGSFWRPDLSFDGKKVLFCFMPHNEKSFHLYEINLDGTDPKQLTFGPYDDLDPIYLPDGHIAFSTTRGNTYVRCMPPTSAFPLARADGDGKNIYIISRNNEPDYLPSVLDDGRMIYTRWEYTDKPLWRAQGLWTANPDGTQVNTLWGNQSVWPDLLKDARQIPGSRRVMFTGSAHHEWFAGSVGIIDPDKGTNFPHGLTKVTADTIWPESGNGPVDPIESPNYHPSGKYHGYYSPYPLSETDFLVSASRGYNFVLYLMDTDGNRELIYEGNHNIFHAVPIRPRKRPPILADRVQWPSHEEKNVRKSGVIYSSNVYYGAPQELQDKAKYLRILNIDPKTYTTWHERTIHSTGPAVSMVQSEGVKRILGTVPIEKDGSVSFNAPSGLALHFQLLDDNYRALQTMRSFTGVMPGEKRGCLGCHEQHSHTPQQAGKPLALLKKPRDITPPPFKDDSISFERYVQPVLDKYCGECHQGDGEAREKLDLTFRPGYLIFNEPYITLIGRPSWGTVYKKPKDPPPGFGAAGMLMVEAYSTTDPAAYKTPVPMTSLSYKSRLIENASSGEHNDVKVDPLSLRRLILWVDTMCPYWGVDEVREVDDPVFQGVDWLSVRPKIKNAPVIVRPGPVD